MDKSKYNRKYNRDYKHCSNVRCNDIKPIERKFFRYLIRQIDYKTVELKYNTGNSVATKLPIRDYCNIFAEKYNIPYKQLMYYLQKWCGYGFYDYGVSLDLGWFCNTDELICYNSIFKLLCIESKYINRFNLYKEAVPARVRRLYIDNKEGVVNNHGYEKL